MDITNFSFTLLFHLIIVTFWYKMDILSVSPAAEGDGGKDLYRLHFSNFKFSQKLRPVILLLSYYCACMCPVAWVMSDCDPVNCSHQSFLPMGFSRQETDELPCPHSGDLSQPISLGPLHCMQILYCKASGSSLLLSASKSYSDP